MRKACDKCGSQCYRDEVDVGVGVICGPWGCSACGWSEDPRYDLSTGASPQTADGVIDQFGGLTPGTRSATLRCFRCHRAPGEIAEYVEAAEDGDPDGYVRSEEGTYNAALDTFACTECYVAIGQPSGPKGWVAPGLNAEVSL